MSNEVTPHVSVNRILGKLRRDFGSLENINESDVIEWTAEALQAIGAITLYEEAVAFIEVKNHQCELPNGLHAIIQLARNICFDDKKECGLCPSDVIAAMEEPVEEGAAIPVAIDCNGQPIDAYDLAYYRPYFDLRSESGYYSSSYLFNNCFSTIRLTNHSFFNSIVCTHPNQAKLYIVDIQTTQTHLIDINKVHVNIE
jgi:hypothetical protein